MESVFVRNVCREGCNKIKLAEPFHENDKQPDTSPSQHPVSHDINMAGNDGAVAPIFQE